MTRGARLAVGLSTAGVLLLLSLVAVAVGAVLSVGDSDFGFSEGLDDAYVDEFLTSTAQAEVLDVDDEVGWTWVDVRFEAGAEVVVTGFDWTGSRPPQLGDTIEVAYDPADPEYAAAAEPVQPPADPGPDPSVAGPVGEDGAGTPASAVAAFWVAGISGALALLVFGLTFLWSSRATEPAGPPGYQLPQGYQPLPGTQLPHGYQLPPGHQLPSGYQVPPGFQTPPGPRPAQPYAPPPSAPTGWRTPSG